MKTLIVCSARPACGKSSWCRKYKDEHENTYIVSSDEIRFEVTGTCNDFSKQNIVWEVFSQRIHEYAALNNDVSVILDALNDLNVLREKYVKENPEFDKYVLVLFPRNEEQIYTSNHKRKEDSWVPENVLSNLIDKYEDPSEDVLKLFDEVIVNEWEERI